MVKEAADLITRMIMDDDDLNAMATECAHLAGYKADDDNLDDLFWSEISDFFTFATIRAMGTWRFFPSHVALREGDEYKYLAHISWRPRV